MLPVVLFPALNIMSAEMVSSQYFNNGNVFALSFSISYLHVFRWVLNVTCYGEVEFAYANCSVYYETLLQTPINASRSDAYISIPLHFRQ